MLFIGIYKTLISAWTSGHGGGVIILYSENIFSAPLYAPLFSTFIARMNNNKYLVRRIKEIFRFSIRNYKKCAVRMQLRKFQKIHLMCYKKTIYIHKHDLTVW